MNQDPVEIQQIKDQLREWILGKTDAVTAADLTDTIELIENRILTSLHVMELILFISSIGGRSLQADRLRPGVFRNIDAIYENFFAN